MKLLISLIVNTISVLVAAYVVPGVDVPDFTTALLVSIVLALLNAIVKPILTLLTLPVTVLTLGLFVFVINAVIVILVSYFVPAFVVAGFVPALLFSLVLSVVNAVLFTLTGK